MAIACALALARPAAHVASEDGGPADAVGWAVALAPGAAVVFLAFNGGGFFPAAPAFVAVALLLVLALRVLLAPRPFAGFSWQLGLAAGAMALFAIWALASGGRSDAPFRALAEFDRALAYALALVVFALGGRVADRVRATVGGVALGAVVVCLCALVTRLLPDVWPTPAEPLAGQRLAYPLTYWNGLGMIAAIAIVLTFHLTTTTRYARWVRAVGAAALPALAVTLMFTYSRGAIGAAALGIGLYLVVGRPRAGLTGVLATAPFVALAVGVAYGADLLSTAARTAEAAAQGRDVALIVAIAALGAAAVRLLLTRVDQALLRFRLPARRRVPVLAGAWAGGILLALVVALATDLPGEASRQYDRFTAGAPVAGAGDPRGRLTSAGDNGRLGMWRIALRGFREEKLAGQGAGTYEFRFLRERTNPVFKVSDAHSLYLDVLHDSGIVGLALVGCVLLTLLLTLLLRTRRRENRTLYAALFAAVAMWAVHAGIDWDWEQPAVTLWVFALSGAALAHRPRATATRRSTPLAARLLVAVACAAVAVVPARVAIADARLGDAVLAYQDGDCGRAAEHARAASRALGSTAQAHEIRGLCAARAGHVARADGHIREALRLEPANWHFHLAAALVSGRAGRDPLPEARTARRLNRLAPATREAVRAFATAEPAAWRRRAGALLRRAGLAQVR